MYDRLKLILTRSETKNENNTDIKTIKMRYSIRFGIESSFPWGLDPSCELATEDIRCQCRFPIHLQHGKLHGLVVNQLATQFRKY